MSDIALQVEQTRAEGMLGASEAAAALGLDRYVSPLVIWKRLRGLPTDEVRSPALDEAASWGNAIEPLVRGQYSLQRGRVIVVPTASTRFEDWLRSTPDGMVLEQTPPPGASVEYVKPLALPPQPQTLSSDEASLVDPEWRDLVDGLLQVKNRSAYLRDDWKDGAPAKEEIQCRVEMAVCDLPWNDCAVLIGGNMMLVHRIERDLALEDRILTDLRAFWQMVKDGREPSPDHTAAWRAHVSEKMRPTKVTMTADDELREIVDYWLEQRRKRKKYAEEEDAAKNDLLLRLAAAGATAIDLGGDRKVTAYKVGGRTDYKGYAAALLPFVPIGKDPKIEKFKTEGKTWSLRAPSDDGDE